MFDAKDFFRKRLKKHIKTLNRYLRYMINGHIAFALFFFISAFSVFYQKWLETIPENFPTAIIIGVVFAFLATYQPIRTLLEEGDLVFIISAEKRMGQYFQRSLIYSYVAQIYVVLLLAAGLGPLYFASYENHTVSRYLLLICIMFVFKLSSLNINWWKMRENDERVRIAETILRYGLGVVIFTSLIEGSMMIAASGTILWAVIFLVIYTKYAKTPLVPWERLLSKDQESMYSFYKLANLFTDVPQIKAKVKRRRLLTKLFTPREYKQSHSFKYLYTLTFLRSGDYFNMFARLTILSGVFVLFIPYIWMQWIIAMLFLYISNLQLFSIYHKHRTTSWLHIYPIDKSLRLQAVQRLLRTLSLIQIGIYTTILLIVQTVFSALVLLGIGLLFTVYFVYLYVPKVVHKKRQIL